MKIISTVPSQTELLYYLGLDKEVIGITKFCIHPTSWHNTKTRIGGTKTLNIEKIRSLSPTLIIANKEENQKEQIEALQKEFKIYMSDILTLEDAYEMILAIGELVQKETKALQLIETLKQQFQTLTSLPPISCAYFIWRKPYMVAAQNTFIDDLLKRASFNNVFCNKTRYPEVSLKELTKQAPQIIFLSSEPYPFKDKHLEEFQIACPNVKIMLVDGELFSWYGSRLLKSVAYFKEIRKKINIS